MDRLYLLLVVAVLATSLTAGTSLHIGIAEAQEQMESSGDLTVPEGDNPFGGDKFGTYSIGNDREGIRAQVNVDISPTSGMSYQAWLVDSTTDTDLALGQLEDNGLATTLQSTDTPYDLIIVTEEPIDDPNPARNSSAVVAGAQLAG